MPEENVPVDNYVLQRNSAASQRLNAQYLVWQRELDFMLHPSIPALPAGSRVADVATGTGVWLLDSASHYPNLEFDGFDVSLSQCPDQSLVPSNIKFHEWDFFKAPPEQMHGKYDVIHLRLVILVLADDPVPVLNNISKLLKPGGYIQWEEFDLTQTEIYGKKEGLKVDGIATMDRIMKGRFFPWILELPAVMSKHGFEDAQNYRFPPKKEWSRYHTESVLLSFTELIASNPQNETSELYAKMIPDVLDEMKNGAAQGITKLVTVARKKRELTSMV